MAQKSVAPSTQKFACGEQDSTNAKGDLYATEHFLTHLREVRHMGVRHHPLRVHDLARTVGVEVILHVVPGVTFR